MKPFLMKWLRWSCSTKLRYVLFWGVLFWGGFSGVLFTLAFSWLAPWFASLFIPVPGVLPRWFPFLSMGLFLIAGFFWSWRMWPIVDGMRAGRIPGRRPPGSVPRNLGKLVLWILIATILVFVFNVMRG
jgi:hypothetical protein